MRKRTMTPAKIMQLGIGFWGSKTLLSAIELGLFTVLAKGPSTAEVLRKTLDLHPRSARDFFDALVALGMLKRTGERYANTPETALFLDRAKPSYVGGILEMANARLYRFWDSLTEGLRTGKAQNEAKTGEDFFGTLYADPQRLEGFLKAMTGLSIESARVIAPGIGVCIPPGIGVCIAPGIGVLRPLYGGVYAPPCDEPSSGKRSWWNSSSCLNNG